MFNICRLVFLAFSLLSLKSIYAAQNLEDANLLLL